MKGFFRNFGNTTTNPPVNSQHVNKEYYCGLDASEIVEKDWWVEFNSARRNQNVKRNNEFDPFHSNMKTLMIKLKSVPPPPKKTHHMNMNLIYNPFHHDPKPEPKDCEICGQRTKQPQTCCLCYSVSCPKCTSILSVEQGGIKHDVPMCSNCGDIQSRIKERENWEKKIDDAENHPLTTCNTVLNEVESCIKKALPKFEEIIETIKKSNTPPQVEELPQIFLDAKKYEKVLNQFFDNYNLGIAKVHKYNTTGPQDKKIQSHFIQGKSARLKLYFPKFRVLQAELRKLTPKINHRAKLQGNTGEPSLPSISPRREIKPPVIISVEPAIIPISGGDLVIRGTHFHPKARVFINGLEVTTTQLTSETLYAVANPYPVAEDLPLFIRNPDADSESMMIHYIDDSINAIDTENQTIEGNTLLSLPPNFKAGSKGWGEDPYKHSFKDKSTIEEQPSRVWGNVDKHESSEEEISHEISEGLDKGKPILLQKDYYEKANPIISTIDPILSPPTGTQITITGYKFAKRVKVKIGNIIIDENTSYILHKDGKTECIIKCYTPALPQGVYSVTVINPKGSQTCMENVLVYVEYEKWLKLTAPNIKQSEPKTTEEDKHSRGRIWG